MKLGDVAAKVGKELFAGVVGTTAMTGSSTLEMKIRGRQGSSAPADAAAKVWASSPRGGGRGPLLEPGPLGLWNVVGRRPGLIDAAGLEGSGAAAVHPGAVWATEQIMLPALGVAPPFWRWGVKEVAIDAFHHLVYVGATSAASSTLAADALMVGFRQPALSLAV